MGVNGLTSYIEENKDLFFKDYKLHNCFVLLDGNSVSSQIYSYSKSNYAFGGDYDKFSYNIGEFISLLLKCDITPIFVFDGAYEERKLKTIIERINVNVRICSQYKNKYKESKCFPLLLKDVFRGELIKRNLYIVQSDFEADQELIIISKQYQWPIISYDSDFFLADVNYIPFNTLNLTPLKLRNSRKEKKYYISCKVFDINVLLYKFGGLTNRTLLPLLSALLGNDYIPGNTFQGFLSLSSNLSFAKKLEKIIKWLQGVRLAEDAIKQMVSAVDERRRKRIRNILFTMVEDTKSYNSFFVYMSKQLFGANHLLNVPAAANERNLDGSSSKFESKDNCGKKDDNKIARYEGGGNSAEKVYSNSNVPQETVDLVSSLCSNLSDMYIGDNKVEKKNNGTDHVDVDDEDGHSELTVNYDDYNESSRDVITVSDGELNEVDKYLLKSNSDTDTAAEEEVETEEDMNYIDDEEPLKKVKQNKAIVAVVSATINKTETEEAQQQRPKDEQEFAVSSNNNNNNNNNRFCYSYNRESLFANYLLNRRHKYHLYASPIPEWLRSKLSKGVVSPSIMNILCSRRLFINSQAEDYTASPSHEIAVPIVKVIVGLLMKSSGSDDGGAGKDEKTESMTTSSGGNNKVPKYVKCHARLRSSFAGTFDITPLCSTAAGIVLPFLDEIPTIDIGYRMAILADTTDVVDYNELFELPDDWMLFVSAVIYWARNCSYPEINRFHLRAVIVCAIYLYVIDQQIGYVRVRKLLNKISNDDQTKSNDDDDDNNHHIDNDDNKPNERKRVADMIQSVKKEDCYQVANALINYHKVEDGLLQNRETFDIKLVHAFAQLQNCLHYVTMLNTVLDFPFFSCYPAKFLSGTFLYNFYTELNGRGKTADEYVTRTLFSKAPTVNSLYKRLADKLDAMIFFESNVDAGKTVTKKSGQGQQQQKNKKKRNKKKKRNALTTSDDNNGLNTSKNVDHQHEDDDDEDDDDDYYDPNNKFSLLTNG